MESMGFVLCKQKSHWQCAAIFLTVTVIFLANYYCMDMITDNYTTWKKRFLRRKLENAPGVFKQVDSSIDMSNNVSVEENSKHSEALFHEFYNVYTPACKIPVVKLPPRKHSYLVNAATKTRKCEKFSPAVSQLIEGTREIKLRDDVGKSECSVMPILRQRRNSFKLGRSINIGMNGSIQAPPSTELLLTRCGKEFTIHTLFPVGRRLYWKAGYWKGRRDSFPISYILLGFDSISRPQFHRTFPKTSHILQQLKFIDLRGFHSVSPYKFDNLVGLLSGMNMKELREKCGKSGGLSLEKCPFIWKNLNWNKYTTMYIDDTQQTFDNFIKKPTDFYPNVMFKVAQSLSKGAKRASSSPCVSNMSSQNYLLDYTKRFILKFGKNPVFSFTWFSAVKDSKEEEDDAASEFDDRLANFFMWLKSLKKLLERTMIIVLSDHEGRDAIEFPVKESYHSLLERSLPALFIRLPELLEERQPGLGVRKVLELNSRRLVTPFDLHHTILHSMVLTGADISEEVSLPQFQPFFIRKSSLLYPIRKDRDCKELNILSDSCICHIPGEAIEFKEDIKLKEDMYNFAIRKINNLIAPYNHSCATFVKSLQPEILALALANNGANTTRALLQFNLDPGNTKFEIRLKFRREGSKLLNFTRVGSFYRLNNNDKSCSPAVKNEPDRRRIAEMCICPPHVQHQDELERQRRSSKKSRKRW